MRVCFVMATEAKPAYENMTRLLCWSIRRRAGVLRDSEISVAFNERSSDVTAAWLREQTSATVITLPRQHPRLHFLNKLNALDAADAPGVGEVDWVVYCDCDVAVINALDQLAEWMDGPVDFMGVPVTAKAAWRLGRIYERHTGLSAAELQQHIHPWFNTEYPYFNGGVFMVRASRLPEFKQTYRELTMRLFKELSAGWNPLNWLRVKWNRKVCKTRHADRLVIGSFSTKFYAEQLALAATVLKLRLRYRVLDHAWNWRTPGTGHGEESPIRILHYLNALHPLDRARLFEPDWMEAFERSGNEGRMELVRLLREFEASSSSQRTSANSIR